MASVGGYGNSVHSPGHERTKTLYSQTGNDSTTKGRDSVGSYSSNHNATRSFAGQGWQDSARKRSTLRDVKKTSSFAGTEEPMASGKQITKRDYMLNRAT